MLMLLAANDISLVCNSGSKKDVQLRRLHSLINSTVFIDVPSGSRDLDVLGNPV